MAMWLFDAVASGFYGFVLVWVAVLYVWVQNGGAELARPLFTYLAQSLAYGVAYALTGVFCGLPVGLVLTFVVGDASGRRTRRDASLTGGIIHAVAGFLLMVLMGGGASSGVLFVVVIAVLVGLSAGWWHDRLASRPRFEDFYAH